MAHLFGLVGTLVLSGAQAKSTTTAANITSCDSDWEYHHSIGCSDPDYNKSVVCAQPCQDSLEQGPSSSCKGDREEEAELLLEYCSDPFSLSCLEAHDVFDFVGCKGGFAKMCSDRCKPYIEHMSAACDDEIVVEESGTTTHLKPMATSMLEMCSDECAMHFGMYSDCMGFAENVPFNCRPECDGHLAALGAEPCSSQMIASSDNSSTTYGEFAGQFEDLCHPCRALYSEATSMSCGTEHGTEQGNCEYCKHLVDQLRDEPRCMGDEMLDGTYPYVDLVRHLGESVEHFCHPCLRLYLHAISSENRCGTEHGDCDYCQHLVGEMVDEPRCMGDEMMEGSYSYHELVMGFQHDVLYYCPQRKCVRTPREVFERLGALHCDGAHPTKPTTTGRP